MEEITLQRLVERYFQWGTIKPIRSALSTFLENELRTDDNLLKFQSEFLDKTIRSAEHETFPPLRAHAEDFIKGLVLTLEGLNVEVDEEFYCILTSTKTVNDKFFKTYFIDGQSVVSLSETRELISKGTTGLRTWQAAQFLLEWMKAHKDVFHGKTIMELGSGVGYTGLGAVKLGIVDRITLTDCHPDVLETLRFNAEANMSAWDRQTPNNWKLGDKEVSIVDLDWTKFDEPMDAGVLIAADVVFDPDLLPSLVQVIHCQLDKVKGSVAFVACTVRNEDTINKFLSHVESKNLKAEVSSQFMPEKFDVNMLPVRLYSISTKNT